MKRVLSILLITVILISTLSLVSCGSAREVDDINGKSAEEAYFDAMALINEGQRYEVVVDMKVTVKLLFIPIPIGVDGFYFYSYDGDNEHHGLTEEGEEFLNNDLISTFAPDMLSGYDKEIWYVDGMCYQISSDGEKSKFASDTSPVIRSELEREVNIILQNDIAEATCYKKGGQYYFELTLEGYDTRLDVIGATKEVYTIYFDEDGYIETINVVCEAEDYTSTLTMHYTYDGLAPITAPADVSSFRDESDYYYYY